MFETEEKTNKALARTQRRGRLAAICRSARREAPQEGSQRHGRERGAPLGKSLAEKGSHDAGGVWSQSRARWPHPGTWADEWPGAPHPSRQGHCQQDTATGTCPRLPGRSSLLAAHLVAFPHCLAAHVCEKRHPVPSRRCSSWLLWAHQDSLPVVLSFFSVFSPAAGVWKSC